MMILSALGRWRQEDPGFKASLRCFDPSTLSVQLFTKVRLPLSNLLTVGFVFRFM